LKKRISALLLAVGLLLNTPALAAGDSTDHFVRSRAYDGQFADVAADSVFYGNIAALYEYGLTVGKPDGTFGPQDPLTVGQTVIFAGRIRSLYRTGDPEAGPRAHGGDGGSAALPYLRYLQAEGILDTELDGCLDRSATRAQMAHVLACLLPEEALPSVHAGVVNEAYASRRAITDVTEYTPYQQDILALYRKGVCMGSDETGSFLPDASITRGAAAAMLTRILDPSLRVTPHWNLSAVTLASLVEPGAYIATPATDAELDQAVRYMLSSGTGQLTLQYPGLSAIQARKIMESLLAVAKRYCEQGYNSVSCNFNAAGSMILTFSAVDLEPAQVEAYRTAALEAALSVRKQLWDEGLLTGAMTETEKAWVYYNWICDHCTYDFSAGKGSLSHLPYSLFALGTAVCDGYTGAYNLFLKLEGIRCRGLSNNGHIWTVAVLDGTEVHIDTTWGDSTGITDERFFAMTPQRSYQYHPW